jgi:hypothetical protein
VPRSSRPGRFGILLIATSLPLAGCGTIMHGSEQVVPITSNPAGGRVLIDSVFAGVTPLQVTLPRSRDARITVGNDSLGVVDVALSRHVSGWVYAGALLNLGPALVDFASGSAHRLAPDSLAVAFPGYAPVPPSAVRDWGLAAGDIVRWTQHVPPTGTSGGPGTSVEAVIDSAMGGLLFLRQPTGASSPAPVQPVIAVTDARGLAVYRAPDRAGGALTGLHYAALAAFAPVMVLAGASDGVEGGFFAGALWSAIAAPVGFLAGASLAQPRWAPFESHRAGSPLLVDDRVRLRTGADVNARVRGRLVDVDSTHMVIATRSDTLRIARAGIAALERVDGRDFRRGAVLGASAGAVVGMYSCSRRTVCGGSERMITGVGGALLGLTLTPALAPHRWEAVQP